MPVSKLPSNIFTMILLIFTGIIAVYGEEVLMLKFKFDYLDNTLAYQTEKDL